MRTEEKTIPPAATVTDVDGLAVIVLCGELDVEAAGDIRAAFPDTSRNVVLDLRGVTFVDSVGLGALFGGIRRSREQGATVAAFGLSSHVAKVFRIAGLDRLITVTSDLREAAAVVRRTEAPAAPTVRRRRYGATNPQLVRRPRSTGSIWA